MFVSCSGHRLQKGEENWVHQVMCFLLLAMYRSYHSSRVHVICAHVCWSVDHQWLEEEECTSGLFRHFTTHYVHVLGEDCGCESACVFLLYVGFEVSDGCGGVFM